MNDFERTYREFAKADNDWGAELQKLFGKHAGDIRYTKTGEGDPGSELNRLYQIRHTANHAWMNARGSG